MGWHAVKLNQPTNQPTNQPKILHTDAIWVLISWPIRGVLDVKFSYIKRSELF